MVRARTRIQRSIPKRRDDRVKSLLGQAGLAGCGRGHRIATARHEHERRSPGLVTGWPGRVIPVSAASRTPVRRGSIGPVPSQPGDAVFSGHEGRRPAITYSPRISRINPLPCALAIAIVEMDGFATKSSSALTRPPSRGTYVLSTRTFRGLVVGQARLKGLKDTDETDAASDQQNGRGYGLYMCGNDER